MSLAVLDSIWLTSTAGIYRTWLGHLFAPSFNFVPAVFFYLLYTAAVLYFVLSPALRLGSHMWTVFLSGAFFGLVAYATYDLTNHATLKSWPLQVTLIDMAWGAVLTGLASVIALSVYNYFR